MAPDAQVQFDEEEQGFLLNGIPLAAHLHPGPQCAGRHHPSCEKHSGNEHVCLPLAPSIGGVKLTLYVCVHSVD